METSRDESLRFFGINQAESIAWKENRDLVENKASKSIGVLYKRSKHIYYTFLHKLRNYCMNQHYEGESKNLLVKYKQVVCIIFYVMRVPYLRY